jgi:ABC-type Fe3+ transport system permease subunit
MSRKTTVVAIALLLALGLTGCGGVGGFALPGLVVALALAFWTLLLAPPGFETLATRIWNATEDAFLADASLASLLLLALSGVLTWFLVVRRGNAPT